MRLNKKTIIKYIPLILIECYLLLSIFLYYFGPVEWTNLSNYKLVIYLCAYHFFFILGYIIALYNKKKTYKLKKINELRCNILNCLKKIDIVKWIKYYVIIGLIMNLFFYSIDIIRTVNSFSISKIIEYIYLSFTNPEIVYEAKFGLVSSTLIGGRMITILATGLSFIYWPVIPVATYYFEKMSSSLKSLYIVVIIMALLSSIVVGTNKGIFDIVIIIITIISTKRIIHLYDTKKKVMVRPRVILIVLFIIGLIFYYFTYSTSSRVGGLSRFDIGYMGFNINTSSGIMKWLPDFLNLFIIMFSIYLTQGYQGMALALEIPFKWTYGIGNNNFVLSNFEKIFHTTIRQNTYQNRLIEFGWDPTINWHTFYTWMANDFTFFGVIIIMFLLGIIVALVWVDSLENKNIFAICLLPLYVLLFLFMPCNNQVLSMSSTFFLFILLNVLWVLTRKEKELNYEIISS
ncbi:MAG: hypothetical protein RSC93_13275 [Erysipelotrichaceae bacterium]